MLSDKLTIMQLITAYKTIGENDRSIDTNFIKIRALIDNKGDLTPFLLELLVMVVGVESLKTLLDNILNQFISKYEEKFKKILKNQFSKNKNINKSLADISNLNGNGIAILLMRLDRFNKLKITEYQKTQISDLEKRLKIVVKTKGQSDIFNGIFNAKYENINNKVYINFRANLPYMDMTISDLLENLSNSFALSSKMVLEQVFDDLFNYGNKYMDIKDLENKLVAEKHLQKYFEDSQIQTIQLNSYDLMELKKQALKRKTGKYYITRECKDSGFEMDIDLMNNIINLLNTELSMDFEKVYKLLTVPYNEQNTTNPQSNEKNNFFKMFIEAIKTNLLMNSFYSMDVLFIANILKAIDLDGILPESSDFLHDFKIFKNFLLCMVEELREMFIEFIFETLKNEIGILMGTVLPKIIEEQIDSNARIFRSLTF